MSSKFPSSFTLRRSPRLNSGRLPSISKGQKPTTQKQRSSSNIRRNPPSNMLNQRNFDSEDFLNELNQKNFDSNMEDIPSDYDMEEELGEYDDGEKLRTHATACVVSYAAYAAFLCTLIRSPDSEEDSTLHLIDPDYERHSLLTRLTRLKNEDCRNHLRMGKDAFARLVYIIKGRGLLRDTVHGDVEKHMATFLKIIRHNVKNRDIKFQFRRSAETISRNFHQVLQAIISLEDMFLLQPTGEDCPPKIKDNPTYWPYFKFEDDQDDSVNDKKNFKWREDMDACLIDSLLEQKNKGQQLTGSFTKAAYKATSVIVSTEFRVLCEPTHIKNRIKILKRHLALIQDIFKFGSGFSYNESTQMIEAEAKVWAPLIKAKPETNQYRFTAIPNFKKLDELFGKDRAAGSKSTGPKQRRAEWEKKQGLDALGGQRQDEVEDTTRTSIQDDDISSSSKAPNFFAKHSDEPKKKRT